MKISELGRLPKEFGRRPNELHAVKPKLLYGHEINDPVASAKALRARKKRNISDMLRFAAMGAAAAVVVTVSASGYSESVERPVHGIRYPEYYYKIKRNAFPRSERRSFMYPRI